MAEPEGFSLVVGEEVAQTIPDFAIDPQRLLDVATNPDGPVGLTSDEAAATRVAFDGQRRLVSLGSTASSSFWAALIRDDSGVVYVRVATRSALGGVMTPEKIEENFMHELVHARQKHRKQWSMRVGNVVVKAGAISGLIAAPLGANTILEAANRNASPVWIALLAAAGLFAGWGAGYRLAPHEREARRVARQIGHKGIVTGTPTPGFATPTQKVNTANAELGQAVRELWQAIAGRSPRRDRGV